MDEFNNYDIDTGGMLPFIWITIVAVGMVIVFIYALWMLVNNG